MKKERVSITINKEFLSEINGLIANGRYKSRSAFIEKGLRNILNLNLRNKGFSFSEPKKIEREKICISLSPEVLREVNYKMAIGTFTSISHAIDIGIRKLLNETNEKFSNTGGLVGVKKRY